MKLRYYLRGLGIGMLVTALVLILSGHTDAKMSDEAVKRRAAELGMVEKDKSVLGDMADADETAKEADMALDDGESQPEDEGEAVSDVSGNEAVSVQDAEAELAEESITFVVNQGDTSISVARRAQEAGLVSSAADFDVFLCQNGYAKRISIGRYELAIGMSEKEIADIITKSVR